MNEASGPAARATDQAKDAAKKGEAAGGGSGSREVAGDLDITYRGRGALGRWLCRLPLAPRKSLRISQG